MRNFKTVWQNKYWIIEARNDLKEMAFIPKGLGGPCYGYLNENKDGFKFDHVPPKYIQQQGLRIAKKINLISIYN